MPGNFVLEPSGTETILLVDDDAGVRNVYRRVLKMCGYRVEDAENGKQAMEMLENPRFRFDLILTDLIMPEMSGEALAQFAQIQHPRIKILFMSGYPEESMRAAGVLQSNGAYLQKPIRPAALAVEVRNTLDGKVPVA